MAPSLVLLAACLLGLGGGNRWGAAADSKQEAVESESGVLGLAGEDAETSPGMDAVAQWAEESGIEQTMLDFAVQETINARKLSGLWVPGETIVSVKKVGSVKASHGVKVRIPRFQRMVVYDHASGQYRIIRAKVEQVGREEKVVDTRDTIKLTIQLDEQGQTIHQALVVVSRAFDGNLDITRFTSYVGKGNLPEEGVSEKEGEGIPREGVGKVPQWMLQAPQEDPPTKATIDVMCLNLWNFNHWEPRIPMLQDLVIRTLPDIIGFQEVRSTRSAPDGVRTRHQVSDLAKVLPGYQYVYEPAMMFEQGEELHQEGLAIFSRYPILKTDFLKLSRDPHDSGDFHQRLCLRALISTPIGEINFMSTHLSLSERARRRTMEEIGKFINSDETPAIIVGDFNSEILKELPEWPGKFGLTDTWKALNPDQPESQGWTFNSWFPKSRIDYIFSRHLTPLQSSIEGTSTIPTNLPPIAGVDDMKGVLFPSDHMFPTASLGVGLSDSTSISSSSTEHYSRAAVPAADTSQSQSRSPVGTSSAQ